jgi:hypothetical protein
MFEEKVKEWVDKELIQEVHEVDHKGRYEFSLYLKTGAYGIHVYKVSETGPLIIETDVSLPPEVKTMLIDHPDSSHVETLLISVLTNSPGRYAILDEEGKACKIEEVDKIKLEKRLYPDVTQQQFMDSVMGIISASRFSAKVLEQYTQNVDSER